MPWRISWSSDAARAIDKLNKKDANRIIQKIEQASENPQAVFSKLVGYEDYKLRIGDYRVIALLLHAEKTIYIEKIGHRKNIYK